MIQVVQRNIRLSGTLFTLFKISDKLYVDFMVVEKADNLVDWKGVREVMKVYGVEGNLLKAVE